MEFGAKRLEARDGSWKAELKRQMLGWFSRFQKNEKWEDADLPCWHVVAALNAHVRNILAA